MPDNLVDSSATFAFPGSGTKFFYVCPKIQHLNHSTTVFPGSGSHLISICPRISHSSCSTTILLGNNGRIFHICPVYSPRYSHLFHVLIESFKSNPKYQGNKNILYSFFAFLIFIHGTICPAEHIHIFPVRFRIIYCHSNCHLQIELFSSILLSEGFYLRFKYHDVLL